MDVIGMVSQWVSGVHFWQVVSILFCVIAISNFRDRLVAQDRLEKLRLQGVRLPEPSYSLVERICRRALRRLLLIGLVRKAR